MNTFLGLKAESKIFHLAQFEIDADIIPYQQQYDSLIYSQTFFLNSTRLNAWFEVSAFNNIEDTSSVLFSDDYISDVVKGFFNHSFITDEVKFIYSRRDITKEDVYVFAASFGSLNASYIFDYFLNDYIQRNYHGKHPLKYYHFDKNSSTIKPAAYNRFIFM